jgi:hypothetical protein
MSRCKRGWLGGLLVLVLVTPAAAKPAGNPLCFRSEIPAYPDAVWALNFLQFGQSYLIGGFVDWHGFRYTVSGIGTNTSAAVVETDLGGNFQRSYINWNSMAVPIPGNIHVYDYYHLYEHEAGEAAYYEVNFRYEYSPLTPAACP